MRVVFSQQAEVAANGRRRTLAELQLGQFEPGRAAAGATVGVGSRILGFLGGPWGIGLSIGIPIIVDLLGKWFNKDQEENDEAAKRQEDLMQMQNLIQQNMTGNITNAVREGVIQGNAQSPQRISVNVNGSTHPGSIPINADSIDTDITLINQAYGKLYIKTER